MPRRVHIEHAYEGRRREQLFEQWRSRILREARDLPTLRRIEALAFADSDVQRDPALQQMLRNVVDQIQAEMSKPPEFSPTSVVTRTFERHPVQPGVPRGTPSWTRERVPFVLQQLTHEFQDHLTRFDETRARASLDRLNALLADYPTLVDAEQITRYERALTRLGDRRASLEAHVEKLRERAVEAARRGDHEEAARALRRLSTIHALRPVLLTDDRFRAIRDAMIEASQDREHRRAAQALVDRERAVAAELRQLGDIIHRFHVIAGKTPHDAPEFLEAERQYHQAVSEVRSHDRDWFAALILELVDLLEEWHDPTHKGQRQVDRFLESVRAALHRLRVEIRQIESELHPPLADKGRPAGVPPPKTDAR